MFDEIEAFEKEFYEKGRKEGIRKGQINSMKESFELGLRNGFSVGIEVAKMRQWAVDMKFFMESVEIVKSVDCLENGSGKDIDGPREKDIDGPREKEFGARVRLEKQLLEIIEKANSFPLENDLDQNLEVLIRILRQKFKIAQALYRSIYRQEIEETESMAANSILSF